jgi:hypothetical protein
MEEGSFKEFMDLKDQNHLFLGDLIYKKVKDAILDNLDKAVLFTMFPSDSDSSSQGVLFTLDREQFPQFLNGYLSRCESEELYEVCSEILDLYELSL